MSEYVAPAAKPPSDTLTIKVNDQIYGSWMDERVTRGVERFPGDFDISVTDPIPGSAKAPTVIAKPGDACTILLGGDVVLTGYIDRFLPSITPESRTMRLTGRGKCEDLVDCAALSKSGMIISGSSLLQKAQSLVAPFQGITATSLSGDGSGQFFSVNINLGESPYEILEPLARYEGLLIYEDANGNVVLSRVGTTKHSSGVTEGVNVQAASAVFSMDGRFDRYIAAYMSTDRFGDIGSGGNIISTAYDKSVLRYRPRLIVSEQSQNDVSLATLRANWELARRRGRSQAITVTVDSWRDSAGLLWQPNYLVPVHVPSCKVLNQTWCISEVTYQRSTEGTTAVLTLMPPEAFTPEPPVIQTVALQIAKDIKDNETATPNTMRTGPS